MNKRRIVRRTISAGNDLASLMAENAALKQKLEDVEKELDQEKEINKALRTNYEVLREERNQLQQDWEEHLRKIHLKDEMLEIKDAAIASLRVQLSNEIENKKAGVKTRKPRRFPSKR